jgi:DNA repair photolyase
MGALFPTLVLSASRRTDLPACYPDALCEALGDYPPETVHTLVLWTKDPVAMLSNARLVKRLRDYRQLFLHVTVTGLGGTPLEPNVPAWTAVRPVLGDMVAFARGAERVVWRFDPIVHVRGSGTEIRNLPLFAGMAPAFAAAGVRVVCTSWLAVYAKVAARLARAGLEAVPKDEGETEREAASLEAAAGALGMEVRYCCVPGKPRSSCIDGALLSRLHPDRLPCSARRARGQRPLCGCTESRDLGWYSQSCPHGCLYCYANPRVSLPPAPGPV